MSRSRRRLVALVAPVAALLVGFVLGVGTQEALAAFLQSGTAQSTFSSDTLLPPTSPAASRAGCLLLKPRVEVTWMPTASTWADGYEISRSLTSGGPYLLVATVSGQATSSYVDSGLTAATTYYFVVKATKAGWRSVPTAQVSVATGIC